MAGGSDRIQARREGAVGFLVFNHPERRNAMSMDMWPAIAEVLAEYQADPAIRAVVMEGAGGKAFVSGADISQFDAHRSDAQSAAAYAAAVERGWQALGALRKPLIASIRGYCMGGGLAIAMKADIRIATRDSTFAIPAARLGIAYPPHAIGDLIYLVGPSQAKRILFTAARMNGEEAQRLGLIDEAVPAEALEDAVRAVTDAIAVNAPLSIEAAKAVANHVTRGSPGADELARLTKVCFDSADYAEGRRAFMEKRPPKFVGR